MSVVVDMFSVVVRVSALEEKYPGGLEGYVKDHGDFTFCADTHLTRVGFMDSIPAMAHVSGLEERGLVVSDEAGSPDVAMVDQFKGILHPCSWLRFAKHPEGYSYCWLAGTEPGELKAQPGWTPKDSRGVGWISHEEMLRALADGRAKLYVGDEIQALLEESEKERRTQDNDDEGSPMSLLFKCPNCGNDVTVRFLKVGDEAKCPSCGEISVVPPEARSVEVSGASPYGIHHSQPTAPPAAHEGRNASKHSPYLASRWKRFWGFMIDQSLLVIPGSVIGLLSARSLPMNDFETRHQFFLRWSETPWAALFVLIVIAIGALQAFLLVTRGQTFGKWVMETRIVTMDYRHPSWWRLVLVRPLIILAAGIRPETRLTDAEWGTVLRFVLSGLFLVNALFVFESDRRALHDHLAGTQVIDLKLIRAVKEARASSD